MSVTIDSNGVQLIGDGFGVNWARKQLAAAPATAKKMQFVYRAWIDTWTGGVEDLDAPWDSCSFFGLGFNNTMFEFDTPFTSFTPADFFGICTEWPPNTQSDGLGTVTPNAKILDGYTVATRGPYAINGGRRLSSPSVYQNVAFWDGIGNKEFEEEGFGSNTQREELLAFASSPAEGAQITHMWEVWSGNTDKTVYMRAFKDNTSVAEGDDMFAVMDGKTEGANAGQIYRAAIHGDVTSNWINSDGVMSFPRWLKLKYTYESQKMVLKYFKVRYLDINENVIG